VTSVLHQGESIFDYPDAPVEGILPLQTSVSAPGVTGLSTATGLILPDTSIQYRLRHLPGDLYDLRPTSNLVRFVTALLGDAGVGQLRKRYMNSQFQSTLQGSHFYDLDRFYGAIFGFQRRTDEYLGVDPLTDTAPPDTWDQVLAADARYRERVIALAKSIPMGGTVPGLRAAAEAVMGVPCEVYEIWALLDSTGISPGANRSWDDAEAAYPTWDDIEDVTWQSIEGAVTYGRSGANSRSEVVIRPKRTYEPSEAKLKAQDEMSLIRVLSVLKPASTLLTVNMDGVELHAPVPIASVSADSEYWEVVAKVRPAPDITNPPYTGVPGQAAPTPVFGGTQSQGWTYNGSIVSTHASSALRDAHWPADGSLGVWYPKDATTTDFAVAANGVRTVYSPDKGVMDARQAQAVRYSSDGVLSAALYVGDRQAARSAT
jgi:hypothetical protein